MQIECVIFTSAVNRVIYILLDAKSNHVKYVESKSTRNAFYFSLAAHYGLSNINWDLR